MESRNLGSQTQEIAGEVHQGSIVLQRPDLMDLGATNTERCADWTSCELTTEISNLLTERLYYSQLDISETLASQDPTKRSPEDTESSVNDVMHAATEISTWNCLLNPELGSVSKEEFASLYMTVGLALFQRASYMLTVFNSSPVVHREIQSRVLAHLKTFDPAQR